jgi:hypothetical protein
MLEEYSWKERYFEKNTIFYSVVKYIILFFGLVQQVGLKPCQACNA